jgi:hypothetical protein
MAFIVFFNMFYLRPSPEMLHCVVWWLVTNVSEQPMSPILKGKAVQDKMSHFSLNIAGVDTDLYYINVES